MSGVWGALGYEESVLRVANSLIEDASLDVIEGPPGVGKSYFARGVGVLWERAGGCTIAAEGDLLRSDVRFYSLGLALAQLSSGWRGLGDLSTEASLAGEQLVGTAGILTKAVQTLVDARPSRRQARIMYLGDEEQQILFEIERLAENRPVLLIADNLHWWDSASLELLGRFREPGMRQSFGVLSDMRVLVAQTSERFQPAAHPLARDALLAEPGTRTTSLPRVPREGFEQVLLSMGAPDVSREVADSVYSLSGGHLALVNRCALRLADGDPNSLLTAGGTDDFISRLLSDRLRSLGAHGSGAIELLQMAAVIGRQFRRDQIACIWDGDAREISRLLRLLRDEDVVELDSDSCSFVHELYHQHFLTSESFDRVGAHERLSDCLRLLSPSRYVLRCDNAIRAERSEEAGTLAVQAALAAVRNGRDWRSLPEFVVEAIAAAGLLETAELLVRAAGYLSTNRNAECLTALSQLPRSLDKRLFAEADYLRAVCLMETRSGEDQEQARLLLSGWAGYEEEEPDVGVRIQLLRLYALAMKPDKTDAREAESQIKRVLRDRVRIDSSAEDAMYTLDRCAPAIVTPEAASVRVRDAVQFFAPPEGQQTPRRPVEYYKSLVTYAAELIVQARFEEAAVVSEQLSELIDDFEPGTFPRVDEPLSNALLADHRLGRVSPQDAVERQRRIISDFGALEDPFYLNNALGIYLCLAGEVAAATELYDQLLTQLAERRAPIPSIEYPLRANRCAVRFVAGDRDGLVREWRAIQPIVEAIPYPIAPILIRRHELLERVLELGQTMTAVEFDECLIVGRNPEFGPLWGQLGRGFRAPELEWFH